MAYRNKFNQNLEVLRDMLLKMASDTEENIRQAVEALKTRDLKLAARVISADDAIDEQERTIETTCLELMATQQPLVAADLRLISMVLKVITDIERIADHASDISEITLRLGGEEPIKPLVDIPKLAEITCDMVHNSILSFINNDMAQALQVCDMDDEADLLFRKVILDLSTMMKQNPSVVDRAIDLIFVAKYFERIGDHATNVAEWVVYNITGQHKHLAHDA